MPSSLFRPLPPPGPDPNAPPKKKRAIKTQPKEEDVDGKDEEPKTKKRKADQAPVANGSQATNGKKAKVPKKEETVTEAKTNLGSRRSGRLSTK